jgi:hypothetical protein
LNGRISNPVKWVSLGGCFGRDRSIPRRVRPSLMAHPRCSRQDSSKRMFGHLHCSCSAQQALSIRHVGSTKPSDKTSPAISRWVRHALTQPVFLVPGWVDLKGDEHDVLLPELVSRFTSTLAEPNPLAGNGLRPPGLTCWIQLSVSRLASAETGPMMAASSRPCARRACTAGQYAPCGLHADAMSSSFLRPRLQRSPAIGPAFDADRKQRHSLRRGEGHGRQSTGPCG